MESMMFFDKKENCIAKTTLPKMTAVAPCHAFQSVDGFKYVHSF
jgi:hypothetical protein